MFFVNKKERLLQSVFICACPVAQADGTGVNPWLNCYSSLWRSGWHFYVFDEKGKKNSHEQCNHSGKKNDLFLSN